VHGGDGFTAAQSERLQRACEAAAAQSGLIVSVGIGAGTGELREQGERVLARLLDGHPVAALLVLVDPGARRLEILTSAPARRRLTDQQCALAALSMTTSFGVGDLVGGVVNGIRMLADAAGVHDPGYVQGVQGAQGDQFGGSRTPA